LNDTGTGDPLQLRRLAIHTNYRGLADLTPSGGFAVDATLPVVPGREFHAFVTLPGADQPVRVLLQLPDAFDADAPCIVVAPVSGSRGIYGGVPVAGPWALPRGCALASTDKGAGTDLFDHASNTGVALDGTRAERGETLGFRPARLRHPLVSVPHAHSGDHPEADWGRHAIESLRFALDMLDRAYPEHAPFASADVRVIAAAISNGGSAALRALERGEAGLFDAAVVAAPNVTPPGARPLYDYATEAALLQPCALAEPEALAGLPFGNPQLLAIGRQRCESLAAAGMLDSPSPDAARARLLAAGFDAGALEQMAVNATLDVWRSVAAMYASAYLRTPVDAMPCGYAVAVTDDDGQPVPAEPDRRASWWATSSGVVPGAGIDWIDRLADGTDDDPAFPGLACLRGLWTGGDDRTQRLRESVDATRATADLPNVPVIVLHGRQDGLIPAAFSARPYVEAARATGARRLAYWEIDGAQHFDVLVPFPGLTTRYRPLLPYLWEALDRIWAVLDGTTPLGGDRTIVAVGRD
jgi:hydroxybutyrate-dimer hydrolase